MLKPKHFLILLLAIILYSCNCNRKYPYAIKDFPKKLQPYLTNMVTTGIVRSGDSALHFMATDAELERLGRSEHPILRASAFREILDRNPNNLNEIIEAHLDDTALVFTFAGEFGIWDRMVSDDILQEAQWNSIKTRNKIVDQVLTKHKYLRSAYSILERLEPQEKYYATIKEMAKHPRQVEPTTEYELWFNDIEYALYGLAKFKKKEDIELIKNRILDQVWNLGALSFRLMKEFPDSTYIEVLQAFYKKQFYRHPRYKPGGFSGHLDYHTEPEDFIHALAVQKTEKSAILLDTMLNRLPTLTWLHDKENLINEVIEGILDNPCTAYAYLRKKTKPRADKIMARRNQFAPDTAIIPVTTIPDDDTGRIIRWFH